MKTLLILACGILSVRAAFCLQPACVSTVRQEVRVTANEFTLADLLVSPACPKLAQAAARLHLGHRPLAGSPRVLTGSQVRELFDRLGEGYARGIGAGNPASIPERITIKGEGVRLHSPRRRDRGTLVRPGQTVTFYWEGDGMSLLGPALCLDRGDIGQRVRVRLMRSGRILPAVVVGAGRLRAAS